MAKPSASNRYSILLQQPRNEKRFIIVLNLSIARRLETFAKNTGNSSQDVAHFTVSSETAENVSPRQESCDNFHADVRIGSRAHARPTSYGDLRANDAQTTLIYEGRYLRHNTGDNFAVVKSTSDSGWNVALSVKWPMLNRSEFESNHYFENYSKSGRVVVLLTTATFDICPPATRLIIALVAQHRRKLSNCHGKKPNTFYFVSIKILLNYR